MHKTLTIAATFLLAAFVVGCGDSEESSSEETATPPVTVTAPASTTSEPAAASNAVTIKMTEFAFDPKVAVAKAGKVTITAPNEGKVVHELVLLKTDADPAKLPMDKGEVDESTAVGEIPDVEAGATKKMTLKLTPGKYVMVCALPGHYEGGMYGSLTVE